MNEKRFIDPAFNFSLESAAAFSSAPGRRPRRLPGPLANNLASPIVAAAAAGVVRGR